jgi:hypothetical protein
MAATQPMHTLREARMRGVLLVSIAFGLVASSAAAQVSLPQTQNG